MIWGSVAVAIPITLIADWLIISLYGNEFQSAADILRIYIWAGIFVSLGVASSKWLVTENLERYSLYRTALGAMLNVAFNFWLIPIYGLKGAAYATLITQCLASFLILLFYKKTRPNFWTAFNSFNLFKVFKRVFY